MLYYNTVFPVLKSTLKTLSDSAVFHPFRLVGGTALSLQLGHRMSIDIDLFTEEPYGSIDFNEIEKFLLEAFAFAEISTNLVAMGKSYYVGADNNNAVKIDVYYSDAFINTPIIIDGLRMASLEDIVAMKIDVVQRKGRKKDFWDLHKLLEQFSFLEMLELHEKRYPYSHDRNLIIKNITDFEIADLDLDVLCLQGKHWETIKLDFEKIDFDFNQGFSR